jgi:hypothetical protein
MRQNPFNAIFRYSLFLQAGPNGADSCFIKNRTQLANWVNLGSE